MLDSSMDSGNFMSICGEFVILLLESLQVFVETHKLPIIFKHLWYFYKTYTELCIVKSTFYFSDPLCHPEGKYIKQPIVFAGL